MLVIQSTQEDARDEISAKIEAMVQAAMNEGLKAHTAFDEDASLNFDPKRQRWWLERVDAQLRKTIPDKGMASDTESID